MRSITKLPQKPTVRAAVSPSLNFTRQGFLTQGQQYFYLTRWELIMHGHVQLKKEWEGINQPSFVLCVSNRLAKFSYIICSSLWIPRCKICIQSSLGAWAHTAECSILGIELPQISFSSWSVCTDVPDVDTDVSPEHLVTTENFRSYRSTLSLLEIAVLSLKF